MGANNFTNIVMESPKKSRDRLCRLDRIKCSYLETTPKQARVEYKKYLNQVNHTLQSLITAGKLKRNELMSINNRAMFNRGKVQRCEWMSKKVQPFQSNFFPDLPNISLDTRSPEAKVKVHRYYTENKRLNMESKEKYLDELIEQQMESIRHKKLIEKGVQKKDIVMEACREIQKTIIEKNHSSRKVSPVRSIKNNIFLECRKNSSHRRSVTDALYKQELQILARKKTAKTKERESVQKNFLRKIRNITLPSN